ncbi:hypothetical protein FSP39_011369 [Pinctada imbricata]|uniref:BTB domain-containing protein n=1 Tax=Pinctada imbricata TaxID=66713 RepID=A0AA88XM16_PINIB|nr:hypothetical protein FSP39_011369 [Pinctada imbricata]
MDVLMSLNHDGKLSDFLYKAYGSRLFCDLDVVTSDQTSYQVHRVVLATFSNYFHKKLKQKKGTDKIQIDIDSSVFKVLLEFMYTGQLSVTATERHSLYTATCILGIESAQELIQNAYVTSDWSTNSNLNSKLTNDTKSTDQESLIDPLIQDIIMETDQSDVKNEIQESLTEKVVKKKSSKRIQEKRKKKKAIPSTPKPKPSPKQNKKSKYLKEAEEKKHQVH